MTTPVSEEKQSIDTSPTYLSPVSAVTPQGQGYPPASLVGLGISGLNELGSFPNPLSYSMSPTFTTQLAPLDNLYSMPLKVDDYTTAPFFPAYNGLPVAPYSPLSTYDSQAMSASPSYNSSLEVNATQTTQNVLLAQAQDPGYWITTSCGRPTRPLEPVSAMENSCMGGQWVQPYYPEAPINVNPPAFSVDKTAYPSMEITDEGGQTSLEQLPALNQAVTSPRGLRTSEFAAHELPSTVPQRRTSPKRQAKREKDKGYACRLCGYVFTRRSNCMEHQKKHDPRSRESHPCDECDKTFGRKADLKRHTNNVSRHPRQGRESLIAQIHRGLRKHTCVWCESHFSRPEALHK